ncbi:hypothetical protein BVRB_5g111790 [Beta vulgaris subsp. vulgaris]|nr:hypothetical protein BVRB_5g111790 [Beta vulgaris subsp. vulgaris]
MYFESSAFAFGVMSSHPNLPLRNSDKAESIHSCELMLQENVEIVSSSTSTNNNSSSTTTGNVSYCGIHTVNSVADDEVLDDRPTTPTSSDQRIPETRPCPPAPRKPKSRPIRKRKFSDGCVIPSSSNSSSVTRLLDFSKEIESMFPPRLQANLGCKIKKARTI